MYTEPARRAIFFARYEASHSGSRVIEADHLILGILRENGNIVSPFWDAASARAIFEDAQSRPVGRETISTSRNLALSMECKRILAYAREEAEHFNDTVRVEHLLLGILREEQSNAAGTLRKHGLQLEAIREKLRKHG
jgi:ATP-dependent Clp protease ATP-binding subunit ClpC